FQGYYVFQDELIIEGVDPNTGVKSLLAIDATGAIRNLLSPIFSVSGFVEFQGALHFSIYAGGLRRQHYRLNGGAVELLPDVSSFQPALPPNSVTFNGARFFVDRCTSKSKGYCLLRYDGAQTTDIAAPAGVSVNLLGGLAKFDSRLWLAGESDGVRSLLVYDGSTIQAHSELNGDAGKRYKQVGDELYFIQESASAMNGLDGIHLYRVLADKLTLVPTTDGSVYSVPRQFFSLKNKNYFFANTGTALGSKAGIFVFSDDGRSVARASQDEYSTVAGFLKRKTGDLLGDVYYFRGAFFGIASGQQHGNSLCRFDGTQGAVPFDTTQARKGRPNNDNHLYVVKRVGKRLYFVAENPHLGQKLFATDGTDLVEMPISSDESFDEYDQYNAQIIDLAGTIFVVAAHPDITGESRLYRLKSTP
ncbi:MAG: hypothetical protein VB934_14020, partial [Polyangiaceae bacterium]